jgi:hypothetical protein
MISTIARGLTGDDGDIAVDLVDVRYDRSVGFPSRSSYR